MKDPGLSIIGETEMEIKIKKLIQVSIILLLSCSSLYPGYSEGKIYINSAFYQDWMGFKSTDSDFYNRLSSRLKLELLDRPGDGWTLSFDVRNRATLGEGGSNQLIIYNSHITFKSKSSSFFFSLGQMNLYDNAGIGELTGGLAGVRISKDISVGGYTGLNPDIYNSNWDLKYRKYGIFSTFRGKNARQATLSYNLMDYDNNREREYIYANALLPFSSRFIIYGSIEYELKEGVRNEDRITHLFTNARLNLAKKFSLNMNYSSGRGIDYHKFILDYILNPALRISEIERFYYSESYGLRFTFSPLKNGRIYISKRYSEQKDANIKNNSTKIGISSTNILKSGFGIYGNYTLNRGDLSESDSYIFSVSRNFNRFSWSFSLSSYFNSIRMTALDEPELIHNPDRKTLSTDLFFRLNRSLAFSAEYSYSYSTGFTDHQFFMRMIYRKRQNKVKK